MSKWSGSDFAGPTENNWPQGVGKFKFPNNVVYEGNFDKGEFHGDGTLHYPNGVSINTEKKDKFNLALIAQSSETSENFQMRDTRWQF